MHCFSLCLWEEHTGHTTSARRALVSPAAPPLTSFLLTDAQGPSLEVDAKDRDGCVCRASARQAQGSCLFSTSQAHTSPELCLSRDPLSHGKAPSCCRHSTWQAWSCFSLSEPISGKGCAGVLRWLSRACFEAAKLQACGELPNETAGGKCSDCLLAFFFFFFGLPSPLNLLASSFF